MKRLAAVLSLGLLLTACDNLEEEDSIGFETEYAEDYNERKALSLKSSLTVFQAKSEGICSCVCDVSPGDSKDEDIDIRGLSRDECNSDTEGESCVTTNGDVGVVADCFYQFRPVVDKKKLKTISK